MIFGFTLAGKSWQVTVQKFVFLMLKLANKEQKAFILPSKEGQT